MSRPIDKSSARVRQMFGEIAGRYDLLNHLLSLGIDRSWRRRTVRLVPPAKATGRSSTSAPARPTWRWPTGGRARGGLRIVGADFCRPMLAIGREKCRRAGAAEPESRLLEADALHLPFADDTFQIVCVAFGLRNVSDTDRGLREMARVCRPGGRVAVLEFSMPTRVAAGPLYGWYFRRVLAADRPGAGEEPPRGLQLSSGQRRAVSPRPRPWLSGCGRPGSGRRVYRFTFGVCTLYVGRK